MVYLKIFIIHLFTKLKRVSESLNSVLSKIVSIYGKKTNVFVPLIICLCVILIFLPIVVYCIAHIEDSIIKYTILFFYIVLSLFALVMYAIIYFRTPDKLHSEWYNIENRKLEMMQQKGGEITFAQVDLIPSPINNSDEK